METIKIQTNSNNYDVLVGQNILSRENLVQFSNRECLLVADSNIDNSTVGELSQVLEEIGSKFAEISIEASENKKSIETLSFIHDKLIELKYIRDGVLFALGGGITCDITGFAAATYQRGVDFVLMPSTLLAQVDASVGGKTAINHKEGKNMIGAFHQPKKVFTDIGLLESLQQKQIYEGLAEIIKHSLLENEGFFEWLEENIHKIISLNKSELMEDVSKSIQIKADVVSRDETEQGVRKFLNLGHTFGHAIELYGNYKEYSHGEAVALGMIMAVNLSRSKLGLNKNKAQKIIDLISVILDEDKRIKQFNQSELLEKMSSDKKRVGDNLNLILLEDIGTPKIVSGLEKIEIKESMKIS